MNIIEEKWDSVVDTLSTEFGFSPISINTWIKPLQVQDMTVTKALFLFMSRLMKWVLTRISLIPI